MKIQTLTRMGREIARNYAALPHDQAVSGIAGHLRSFWTPAMIAEIEAFAATDPGAVDPLLLEAIRELGG
ncbi:MAG: formate dehydrogenase subunit delta [Mycobacterium sp.]